jgi:hypothetical protein
VELVVRQDVQQLREHTASRVHRPPLSIPARGKSGRSLREI